MTKANTFYMVNKSGSIMLMAVDSYNKL